MKKKDLQNIVNNRHGLNVELKNDFNMNDNLLHRTLKNYNIETPEEFIHPIVYNETQVEHINNINKMNHIENSIKQNKSVGVLVDVDTDGITSSAMLINYFKELYPENKLIPILPSKKKHGIKGNMELINREMKKYFFDLIIAPDSSSNDLKEIKELNSNNTNVIVIDHHMINNQVESSFPNFIINNQSIFNKNINKHFTGAGMVYQCLKYLDIKNNRRLADKFLDLFSVGQIGDMSDVSNLEIRALMLHGFKNIENKLLKKYIKLTKMQLSPKGFAFGLIPLFNAVMRIGTHEDRLTLFNALIDVDNKEYIITKRKNVNHHFVYEDKKTNIYNYIINRMEKIKNKQKSNVNKALKNETYLSRPDYTFNMVLLNNNSNGITGLIANKVMSLNNKPTFILNKKDHYYSGSMRIPMRYTNNLEKIRSSLKDIETLDFVQGHENAAGIAFRFTNERFLNKTLEILNTLFTDVEVKYEVDNCLINSIPSKETFFKLDKMNFCFGGSIKEPKLAILGLRVKKPYFKINKNTLHININGIDFIKFNLAYKEKQNIMNNTINGSPNPVYVDIVGELSINKFLGKNDPQFIMDDLMFTSEIEDYEEDLVF